MSGGLVLGVDGGGTKTLALVADPAGRIVGRGEAGSSNSKSVGWDAATAALRAAIAAAGAQGPVDAACLGMAGADTDAERARLLAWLRAEGVARRAQVVHDADIVLAAARPLAEEAPWGIALVCGTGSVCAGVSRAGDRRRVGGWGYLLGDEGSGYDIAVRALRRATASADGRLRPTAVLQAALDHWRCASAEALSEALHARPPTRAEMAAFSAPVLGLAEAGDEGAREVVGAAAHDAAQMLETIAAWLDDPDAPVAFAGGVLLHSKIFRATLRAAIQAPIAEPVLIAEPAEGALALARRDARSG